MNRYQALAEYYNFDDDEQTANTGAHIDYEIVAIGSRTGGEFEHTSELKVVNYREVITKDD